MRLSDGCITGSRRAPCGCRLSTRSGSKSPPTASGWLGMPGRRCWVRLADRVGLTGALGWRVPGRRRRHLDAAVLRDLAVMLADGGDCLSDLAVLRDQPGLFGPVASTPTAWRVLERLAQDPDWAGPAARRPGARPRAGVGGRRGDPEMELLVIDADATLVLAHSRPRKVPPGPTRARSGSPRCWRIWTAARRPGSRWPGTPVAATPPRALPMTWSSWPTWPWPSSPRSAADQPVLVRSDSAGASTRLAWHLRDQGVGFSVGMPIDAHLREAVGAQPERAWIPAVDPDGQPRAGAEVVELTGWVDLHTWPPGTRAICRREDAHPGAQLRFSDLDGHRFQVFLTDQPDPDLAGLELRHRQRARVEDLAASAPPRPPAYRTSRSIAGEQCLAGAAPSPKTCRAGPRRCCWMAPSRSPSPRPCATGCSMSPPEWSATPAARSFACNAPGPGPSTSPGRSPGCVPCRRPPSHPPSADDSLTHHGSYVPPCPPSRPPPPTAGTATPAPPRPATQPSRTPLARPDSRPHDRHHALMKSRG